MEKICHITFFIYIRISITVDFKPASVDAHKEATLETGTNNQVTVTVPHLGMSQTFWMLILL